ncbi:hypothetical protein SRHO_G00237840 [Serrasalmus rhombeus]
MLFLNDDLLSLSMREERVSVGEIAVSFFCLKRVQGITSYPSRAPSRQWAFLLLLPFRVLFFAVPGSTLRSPAFHAQLGLIAFQSGLHWVSVMQAGRHVIAFLDLAESVSHASTAAVEGPRDWARSGMSPVFNMQSSLGAY